MNDWDGEWDDDYDEPDDGLSSREREECDRLDYAREIAETAPTGQRGKAGA